MSKSKNISKPDKKQYSNKKKTKKIINANKKFKKTKIKTSPKKYKSNKNTKSNKITKSKKYKKTLNNFIKFNIYQFKNGKYKSKKQAIAISYKQANNKFNL
jgi:hypothetical protein